MIILSIPTEEDRIASLYGEQIKQYSEAINQAILTGDWQCGRFDYLYVPVNNGEYIHSEITNWLKTQYKKAGWLIEANGFDDEYHYRLFRTKPTEETKHGSSRPSENSGEDIPD
jgi:hypothetical protein